MATSEHSDLAHFQALLKRGGHAEALRIGESLIGRGGAAPELLHIVGVLACQSGDAARGLRYLEKAFAARPDADIRMNLVRALIDTGAVDKAETLCRDGERDVLVAGEFTRLRADLLRVQGRPEAAAELYRRVVAGAPNNFEAWNNLGNALHDAGAYDEAVGALVRARDGRPALPMLHLNLSRALASAGRLEEALASAGEAARLSPGEIVPLLDQAKILNQLHRYADALPLLGSAARIKRDDPDIYVTIGVAYGGLAQFSRAEEAHRMALRVDPRCPRAYLELGLILEQSNRVEDIGQLLRVAEAHGVATADLSYLEALVLRREGSISKALEKARAAPPTIDLNLRAQLIGQLADRAGHYDEAIAAFKAMNAEVARDPVGRHFEPAGYRRSIELLTDLTTLTWRASWRSVDIVVDRPAPVFLVGFPRSGTTLLDTILMGHPETAVFEEEPMLQRVHDMLPSMAAVADLDAQGIARLRSAYFAEADTRAPGNGNRLLIDKLPLNLLRSPLIARIFPDARFIFAQRHPCDVVLSCFMQNFRINQAMASFLTLEDSALLYDRVLNYWQHAQKVFALPTHLVTYELMVEDLESEMRPLLDFLGLEWSDAVLDHQTTAAARGYIRTPSYSQVFERIYMRSSGRWEKYRGHMASVLPILGPWAEHLGYGPVDAAEEGAN